MKAYGWLIAVVLLALAAPLAAQPGVTVDYCTYLGGAERELIWDAEVAGSRLLLGGYSSSPDYPTTPGVWRESMPPSIYGDGTITVLDLQSHAVLASSYVGGDKHDVIHSVCTDGEGNIYVAGQTSSTDLPGTEGSYQPHAGFEMAGFVVSMTRDLSQIRWLTHVDSPCWSDWDDDYVEAVAHSPDGHLYVTGYITRYDCISWDHQLADTLGQTYLLKLDDNDGSLVWMVNVGTMAVHAIDCFPNGDVLLGGSSSGNVPVSGTAFQTTPRGGRDHYLAAIHQDGTFAWGTYVGGMGGEAQLSAKVIGPGRLCFAGISNSADYPVTSTSWGMEHFGNDDLVVGVLGQEGKTLEWCGYLGGSLGDGYDVGHGIGLAVDDGGHLYMFTSTESPDLPVTPDAYQSQQEGTRINGVMASLDVDDGDLRWLSYFGGPELIVGNAAAAYPGGLAVTGFAVMWDGATHGLPATSDALSDTLTGASDGFVAFLGMDGIVPTLVQSSHLTWDTGTAVLHWRISGETTALRAEVVTAGSVRELPLQREPDGAWIARDDQACAAGPSPRTYRLVLPGENRWTELWRREVTPECAAAGPLRLVARLLGGGAVELRLRSPRAGVARVALYDLAGRRVAELPERTVPAGESVWEWDGRTAGGGRAPAGRYLARCVVAGRAVTAAVTLVR